jgi:prepilin-type processing-associated H-X9-DG protein
MDCREAEALAVERALADPTSRDFPRLAEHVAGCARCRAVQATLARLTDDLEATVVDPPQGLAGRAVDYVGSWSSSEDSDTSPQAGPWRGLGPAHYAAGAVVAAAVVAMLGLLFLPHLTGVREYARRAACLANQKQIFTAMALYADNWGGHYPAAATEAQAFALLVKLGMLETDAVFLCPSSPVYAPLNEESEPDPLSEAECAYAFDMTKNSSSPAAVAVLGDRTPANHDGEGVNVTYNDGHVAWQEGSRLSAFKAAENPVDRLYFWDDGLAEGADSHLAFRAPRE